MPRPPMTIATVNALDQAAFVATLGSVFEHSPWIAASAWTRRPFASLESLHAAMVGIVREAPVEAQLALVRAHPELAGQQASRGELTAHSRREQAAAGLSTGSSTELGRLQALNRAYREKFGFPFVIAVKGLDAATILTRLAERLERDRDVELSEALTQIARIARWRLEAAFAATAEKR